MQRFIPGQRWASAAESQLGLGTVLGTEHRTVTLLFVASGETRTYAMENAPLTRVRFVPGDHVRDSAGNRLLVERVEHQDGLYIYHARDSQGQPHCLPETGLDPLMQLNRPAERLFNGQVDPDHWYELRQEALSHANRLARWALRGLAGARTALIPHQLYIAHEVSGRYAPRVLLADEVGLGKTIEAGLILHRQLITEQARRILLLVPDSLLHQWLVEMLRRFNLLFHLFDRERCATLLEQQPQSNPFHAEQRVLCSLSMLTQQPEYAAYAAAGEWDLLVVDEAHHLAWAPQSVSPEYRLVEQLATGTPGVLLLTGTPEQLGRAGHFARLRLLDPDRFSDYETFLQQERAYEPVARAADRLLQGGPLRDEDRSSLEAVLDEPDSRALIERLTRMAADTPEAAAIRERLVQHLLDRHGTGRILFRNTRATVHGFPARERHITQLARPAAWDQPAIDGQCPCASLTPERTLAYKNWTRLDPRVGWLANELDRLKPEKVLVIATHAQTVRELAEYLRQRAGIHAALFHEGMSLVERDRAAAFFADPEQGSQLLLCSEIGSEGRNFQFARHLVLFDLPPDPERLEQRIGRLDRIGQSGNIHIHLPCITGSAQQVMLRWFDEGLDAFHRHCPAAPGLYAEFRPALGRLMAQTGTGEYDPAGLDALLAHTRSRLGQLETELERGRDRLLELAACRPAIAEALCEQARAADRHNRLPAFMERLFDAHGVEISPLRPGIQRITAGEHLRSPFPGLPGDGMNISFEREVALANEDVQFLSWDHPMVRNALDLVLSAETGNTALSALAWDGLPAGSMLLEALFVLEPATATAAGTARFLPPTRIRLLLDETGQRHEAALDETDIRHLCKPVDPATAARVIGAREAVLRELVGRCEKLARDAAPALQDEAREQAQTVLGEEIERLHALRRHNPAVREEEIRYFESLLAAALHIIDQARPRLDALRVLVVIDQ